MRQATLTAMTCLAVAACDGEQAGGKEETLAPRVPQVRTMVLQPQPWLPSIRAYGVIEPIEEVDITSGFPATVKAVGFREGEAVAAGAVLIEFDRHKRNLRLQGAEAHLKDARAAMDEARDTFERHRKLYQESTVSRARFRVAEAALLSARARTEQALANRNLARREVQETRLVSPVAGVVVLRAVEPGEKVLAGAVLGTIQTTGAVRVVTYVSEKDINAVRVGSEARVTSPGVRGREYEGRIDLIGFRADPRTGNFPVKLTVANDDGLLRHGMTAEVVLRGLQYDDSLVIPRAALVDRDRRRVVYTLVDGRAMEVEPALTMGIGDMLRVLDGLAAGDELIVDGLDTLAHGAAVVVAEEEAP